MLRPYARRCDGSEAASVLTPRGGHGGSVPPPPLIASPTSALTRKVDARTPVLAVPTTRGGGAGQRSEPRREGRPRLGIPSPSPPARPPGPRPATRARRRGEWSRARRPPQTARGGPVARRVSGPTGSPSPPSSRSSHGRRALRHGPGPLRHGPGPLRRRMLRIDVSLSSAIAASLSVYLVAALRLGWFERRGARALVGSALLLAAWILFAVGVVVERALDPADPSALVIGLLFALTVVLSGAMSWWQLGARLVELPLELVLARRHGPVFRGRRGVLYRPGEDIGEGERGDSRVLAATVLTAGPGLVPGSEVAVKLARLDAAPRGWAQRRGPARGPQAQQLPRRRAREPGRASDGLWSRLAGAARGTAGRHRRDLRLLPARAVCRAAPGGSADAGRLRAGGLRLRGHRRAEAVGTERRRGTRALGARPAHGAG